MIYGVVKTIYMHGSNTHMKGSKGIAAMINRLFVKKISLSLLFGHQDVVICFFFIPENQGS